MVLPEETPWDKKETEIVKLWDKEEKRYVSAYSRAYHNEIEWPTEESARSSNVHDIFEDKDRYEVHRFKVLYIRV